MYIYIYTNIDCVHIYIYAYAYLSVCLILSLSLSLAPCVYTYLYYVNTYVTQRHVHNRTFVECVCLVIFLFERSREPPHEIVWIFIALLIQALACEEGDSPIVRH